MGKSSRNLFNLGRFFTPIRANNLSLSPFWIFSISLYPPPLFFLDLKFHSHFLPFDYEWCSNFGFFVNVKSVITHFFLPFIMCHMHDRSLIYFPISPPQMKWDFTPFPGLPSLPHFFSFFWTSPRNNIGPLFFLTRFNNIVFYSFSIFVSKIFPPLGYSPPKILVSDSTLFPPHSRPE